jgi:hypothetical protein
LLKLFPQRIQRILTDRLSAESVPSVEGIFREVCMDVVWAGLIEGLRMLFSWDAYLWEIIALSARVSGARCDQRSAGVPAGAIIGLTHFPGRRVVQG